MNQMSEIKDDAAIEQKLARVRLQLRFVEKSAELQELEQRLEYQENLYAERLRSDVENEAATLAEPDGGEYQHQAPVMLEEVAKTKAAIAECQDELDAITAAIESLTREIASLGGE